MDTIALDYEKLLNRFVDWANSEPDMRAALVIGSRARSQDHPADEWSDLDLLVIAENLEHYIASSEWVAQMGVPWLTFVERTADGSNWERRVLFEGGLDVDFALLPAATARQMQQHGLPAEAKAFFQRGMRILFDKDGLLTPLAELGNEPLLPPQPPSQHEFLEVVNDFWYHAVWTAKHLRRGELWWAKSGCDGRLKDLLRRMLEWHAQAHYGSGHDTWFRGRFLEEWIDPRARQALPEVFAHYDAEDLARALFATMELFRWLASESAEHLGYPYPRLGDERATEWVYKTMTDV